MSEPFTKVHFDFAALGGVTNPRHALGLEAVALGLIRLPTGQGYTFTHHHEEQEEVYVVVGGEGELLVEGESVPLVAGDVVRVSAPTSRALRAGSEPLFVVCAGAVPAGYPRDPNARYLIDDGVPHYDDVPPWYAGDATVREKNAALKERMERARKRREQGG